MKAWKELGEIPDSEDDENDGQEAFASASAVDLVERDTIDELADDIWDIPSSQNHAVAKLKKRVFPTRFSEDAETNDLLNLSSSQGLAEEQHGETRPPALAAQEPPSSPLSVLSSIIFDEQDISPKDDNDGNAGLSAQSNGIGHANQSLMGSPQVDPRISPSPLPSPPPLRTHPSPTVLHENELLSSTNRIARYERSFRTRKPIQEHPFLLEAAQYSKVMMTHGVKPLKIAIEAEAKRRHSTARGSEHTLEASTQDSVISEYAGHTHDAPSQVLGDDSIWDPPLSSPSSSPHPHFGARPSSQVSLMSSTDVTSLAERDRPEVDDLPALGDLLFGASRPPRKRTPKRVPSTINPSSKRLRRRLLINSDNESVALSPTPREPSGSPSKGHGDDAIPPSSFEVPNFMESRKREAADTALPDVAAQAIEPLVVDPVNPINPQDPSHEDAVMIDSEDSESTVSSEDEPGENIVSEVSRRIRGVLPASWIRLDKQADRDKMIKKMAGQAAKPTSDRDNRKGIAQRRYGLSKIDTSVMRFSSDESDNEPTPVRASTPGEPVLNQTRLTVIHTAGSTEPPEDAVLALDDSAGSAMEDDQLDSMLPSRKRLSSASTSHRLTVKRRKHRHHATTSQKSKQPRITSAFRTQPDHDSPIDIPKKRRQKRSSAEKTKRQRQRRITQQVGILDVIPPDAPRFLRIAARTAKRRPNLGRGSPSRKSITLAVREDHIDAAQVLEDWRAGNIPQKSLPRPVRSNPRQQNPELARASPATYKTPAVNGNDDEASPRKLLSRAKEQTVPLRQQMSSGFHPLFESASSTLTADRHSRPAQLEIDNMRHVSPRAFHTRKSALDRMFQKSHAELLSPRDAIELPQGVSVERGGSPEISQQASEGVAKAINRRPRHRKQLRPVRLDTESPRYSLANDPLPRQIVPRPSSAGNDVSRQVQGLRMTGLGPYGTHYTHHFEIFPLDGMVYCHESTIVGNGTLDKVLRFEGVTTQDEVRPAMSLQFHNEVLRWGLWSAETSSELGLVFDWITETIAQRDYLGEHQNGMSPVKAAHAILTYVKDHSGFAKADDIQAFVARFHELLGGFINTLNVLIASPDYQESSTTEVSQRICERLLLATSCVLASCRANAYDPGSQGQIEDQLVALAKSTMSLLIKRGTADVRNTYKELSKARVRSQGLREDASTLHTWIVVMKVLDAAHIVRSSFWNLVQVQLAAQSALKSHDAQQLDTLWQDYFTFLPIVEFSSTGVLLSGSRHQATSDGWGLPQVLLRNLLQLYRDSPQQPASFNDYCRATIGRCHYLVDQWGWRKSAAVIGVIFDFFGSQKLAHLRNEEVYRSPQFLELLANRPSLKLEPEDRCFHVFLKLLALTIQKLREAGLNKDIRNLVARTMPNHDRQYSKDLEVHQSDVSALRNHHDLLCTLFWVCPPDLRPKVDLIEALVDPSSSHKETCLVNLRAWNQLARFLVANGEAKTTFKALARWRDGLFTKIWQQYNSVASDVNLVLHSMVKEDRQHITAEMLKMNIATSKSALQDILYLAVKASHDVMRHCSDLEAAMFTVSVRQLQQILDHFTHFDHELDWAVLRPCLMTLDIYLKLTEDVESALDSQERESQLLDAEQADDAMQMLDHDIAKTYFSMARCILKRGDIKPGVAATTAGETTVCKDLVVSLSARLAARFINTSSASDSDLFSRSKYGIFDDLPHRLQFHQRNDFIRLMANLLQAGIDDFTGAGFTLLDTWLLATVKPREAVSFEKDLGLQLQRLGSPFVTKEPLDLGPMIGYGDKRRSFQHAITYMRQSVRSAGPSNRKEATSEYKLALERVMQQMKADLKVLASNPADTAGHQSYIMFVRDIISLIRSHGSDICKVDEFFYQISADYSPPSEDPQLHVATMVSYGLRLAEDEKAGQQQMFYFLFNSFKISLSKNKLTTEAGLLANGMSNPSVRKFVLGTMLPASLAATWRQPEIYPMVDVHIRALRKLLTASVLPLELMGEDLDALVALLSAMVSSFRRMHDRVIDARHVLLFTQALDLTILVWPSIQVQTLTSTRSPSLKKVQKLMNALRHFTLSAEAQLGAFLNDELVTSDGSVIRAAIALIPEVQLHEGKVIKGFTESILQDVDRNWTLSESRIEIRTPAKGLLSQAATQHEHGIEARFEDLAQSYVTLVEVLKVWNGWWLDTLGSWRDHHQFIVDGAMGMPRF